ncbi:hypothetical protein, partial [Campylobacter sp. US53]|uniref:hypothetical protein n=1 Tax=Campylobacter sp. US53 TaxID=2498124 RepID=UPI001ABAE487
VFSTNRTAPVEKSGFKQHCLCQRSYTAVMGANKDNVFDVFIIINFHDRKRFSGTRKKKAENSGKGYGEVDGFIIST